MNQEKEPHTKEFQIFVNSRPRKVIGPMITFAQLLQLAGVDTSANPALYEVEWIHGHRAGTLVPGQSVDLENGMRFDVGKSNRS